MARDIPSRLLVATRNAGKLRELRALFAELGWKLVDLGALGVVETATEDLLESESTFEGNALAKAMYFQRVTGLPTVADDSGLAVDALSGAPGVHSKRYAGASGPSSVVEAANNAKLIAALHGASDRRARFVCAAAYVDGARSLVVRGETTGRMAESPSGDGGFGYDPHFVSDDLGRSFGEASLAEKQRVSHRARAFRALLTAIGAPSSMAGSVDALPEPG